MPSDAAITLDTVRDLDAARAELAAALAELAALRAERDEARDAAARAIAELDAAGAERDAARAVAARANEELEHLARMASHDLRAPLRSVKGFAALLARRYAGRLDADADEYLGFLTGAAEQMDALISDAVAQARAVAKSGSAGTTH